ncbi:MAG: hypothetical protein ACYTFH_02245 [Planctomycetota bacterium]
MSANSIPTTSTGSTSPATTTPLGDPRSMLRRSGRLRRAGAITAAAAAAIVAMPFVFGCGGGDDESGPVPPAPIESSAPRGAGPASLQDGDLRPATEAPFSPQMAMPPVSDDPTDPQNWRVTGPDDDPRRVEVGGLHSLKPASWTWQRPTVQFRTLQFTVPGRDGAEAADLIFSLFVGREGGPLQLNIDRWGNQFLDEEGRGTEPLQDELMEFELPMTFVEHRGSYLSMGAAAPRSDHAQLAAIVEAPGRRLFIRLTGPESTVEANRPAFMEMLRNLRPINLALPGDAPAAAEGDSDVPSADETDAANG